MDPRFRGEDGGNDVSDLHGGVRLMRGFFVRYQLTRKLIPTRVYPS